MARSCEHSDESAGSMKFGEFYYPAQQLPAVHEGLYLTLWRRNYFLILAHPVYKMLIMQEPNKLAL